ncbi:LOW QUALITY PROTEIN: hypothetical protein U9M48_036175 [Paspalum notatum var. saurae]|uniref:Reverse transcriptase Ty1/copia-type domain-containing protein n=1 Tax=Paspalum notatum var. saurae TaxID=547442 RepID=A0AAQ3XAT7_PASNO
MARARERAAAAAFEREYAAYVVLARRVVEASPESSVSRPDLAAQMVPGVLDPTSSSSTALFSRGVHQPPSTEHHHPTCCPTARHSSHRCHLCYGCALATLQQPLVRALPGLKGTLAAANGHVRLCCTSSVLAVLHSPGLNGDSVRWIVHHLDVKSAFLNGELTERPGFVVAGRKNKVLWLRKALYGLRQAPRVWNIKLDSTLATLGFKKCASEHALYTRRSKEGTLIVGVYVDDLIVTGSLQQEIDRFKKEMAAKFKMSDLGLLSYYLGIEVKQAIELCQSAYALKLQERAGLKGCNPTQVPMQEKPKLDATQYRSLIGGAEVPHTRPDITFAVGYVSRFMEDPHKDHMAAVKHLLRYIAGSYELGFAYPRRKKTSELELKGFSDSDIGGGGVFKWQKEDLWDGVLPGNMPHQLAVTKTEDCCSLNLVHCWGCSYMSRSLAEEAAGGNHWASSGSTHPQDTNQPLNWLNVLSYTALASILMSNSISLGTAWRRGRGSVPLAATIHVGCLECKPCLTPVDTSSKLSSVEGALVRDATDFRSLAGALQYLTFTRLDIAYAVQQVCLHMHAPREPHLAALKRILRYIHGTLDLGLLLRPSASPGLVVCSDVDWAGCPDTRKSISSYAVFLGDSLVSWSPKPQVTVPRSSAEAEYRAVANAVVEASWLRQLLMELHTPLRRSTLVYYDNISTIYMASNPHQRTKHIEIDLHFVRDRVALGEVRVLHVPASLQFVANSFQKMNKKLKSVTPKIGTVTRT